MMRWIETALQMKGARECGRKRVEDAKERHRKRKLNSETPEERRKTLLHSSVIYLAYSR